MNSDIAAQGGDEAEIERVGSQVTARSRASMSAADADAGACAGRYHARVFSDACFCSVFFGARLVRARVRVCQCVFSACARDYIE